MNASSWAVVAAILGLATWAHYAFWSWRFQLRTGEDERRFADTSDGWRVGLAHRKARRTPPLGLPVVLCHGIAANRTSLDFGLERFSLSAYLASSGFDCWAVDLRGHGFSHRAHKGAPRNWTFDDHVRLDVPAVLDAVREATGHDRVTWIGHSQGGLIGMAACELYPDRIASLVTIASPAFFGAQDPLKLVARFGFLFTGRLNRFAARMLSPFSGIYHPPVGQVAINGKNVDPPVFRRMLVNVVENISPGVIGQFAKWIATDTFASLDGEVDYRARLASCRQPGLFVAAAADRLAPPVVVNAAAKAWGGESTVLHVGVEGGGACDYGHSDLLFGRRAPEDVFPRIRDWLLAHVDAGPREPGKHRERAAAPEPARREAREA